MILQVHDELIIECPISQTDTVSKIMRETMESAAELRVPLIVDIGTGKSWFEAHKLQCFSFILHYHLIRVDMTVQNINAKKRWKLLVGDKNFAMRAEYQEQLLKLIVLIAIPMLLGFAIFNATQGFQTLASTQFITALLLVPMMLSCCFRKIFSIPTLEVIILCAAIVTFQSLIIFGGYFNDGLYWVPIFPFLAFFTVGLYKGWFWVLAYFIIGMTITFLGVFDIISIAYKLEELEMFLTSFNNNLNLITSTQNLPRLKKTLLQSIISLSSKYTIERLN